MFESISSRMAVAGQNLRGISMIAAFKASTAIDVATGNIKSLYEAAKVKAGEAVDATVRSATSVYEFVMPKTTDHAFAFDGATAEGFGETINVKPTSVTTNINYTQSGTSWFAEDEFIQAAKKAVQVSLTFKLVLSVAFIGGGVWLLTTGLSPVWFGVTVVALSTEVLNLAFLLYAAKKGAQ